MVGAAGTKTEQISVPKVRPETQALVGGGSKGFDSGGGVGGRGTGPRDGANFATCPVGWARGGSEGFGSGGVGGRGTGPRHGANFDVSNAYN